MKTLIIARGDITDVSATIIVNAANSSLLGGGGVDGAIHKAAGPGLRSFNEDMLRYCPPGEIRISPALGRLQKIGVQWIFNTVGPIWTGTESRTRCSNILRNCYRNLFTRANQIGAYSIAIPSISTGIYGFPIAEATAIALHEVRKARETGYQGQIILVAFDRDTGHQLEHEARYTHTPFFSAYTPFIGKLAYNG